MAGGGHSPREVQAGLVEGGRRYFCRPQNKETGNKLRKDLTFCACALVKVHSVQLHCFPTLPPPSERLVPGVALCGGAGEKGGVQGQGQMWVGWLGEQRAAQEGCLG